MATAVNGEAKSNALATTEQPGEYNQHHLVGSLLDEDEEPVPLLYFTSFGEAFVSPAVLLSP